MVPPEVNLCGVFWIFFVFVLLWVYICLPTCYQATKMAVDTDSISSTGSPPPHPPQKKPHTHTLLCSYSMERSRFAFPLYVCLYLNDVLTEVWFVTLFYWEA